MEVHPVEIRDDCSHVISGVIAKGKRTKRRRLPSPSLGVVPASTCSSSSGVAGDRDGDDATLAPTTSVESMAVSSTEEEEDMANCLILLARGGSGGTGKVPDTSMKSGVYLFECKTCNRVFPSFQALGGHRASHKKPKFLPQPLMAESAMPALLDQDIHKEDVRSHKITALPSPAPVHLPGKAPVMHGISANVVGSNKQKVHECSICGLEFGSGQALGGHMRRHRATPTVSNLPVPADSNAMRDGRLSGGFLQLDLNHPAPVDDCAIDSKFGFGQTQHQQQQRILLSSPTLVDCHY
ncbi:hypothetical protein MLD38_003488 [Melastoma candidum]|uniref:Uncharacterized protein n=1 Tax=Melastoma candidum TaxID=119954 RepID=A0ACB9S4Q3_9MYRT|nr:hypothetical protein MLD38_003488 [Melastoma candidum]